MKKSLLILSFICLAQIGYGSSIIFVGNPGDLTIYVPQGFGLMIPKSKPINSWSRTRMLDYLQLSKGGKTAYGVVSVNKGCQVEVGNRIFTHKSPQDGFRYADVNEKFIATCSTRVKDGLSVNPKTPSGEETRAAESSKLKSSKLALWEAGHYPTKGTHQFSSLYNHFKIKMKEKGFASPRLEESEAIKVIFNEWTADESLDSAKRRVERFVNKIYRETSTIREPKITDAFERLLGRSPSTAELMFFINLYRSSSSFDLIASVATKHKSEFEERYKSFYGRKPSQDEFNTIVAKIRDQGISLEATLSFIVPVMSIVL